MVDGGANICLTGTLSLLVDTISIPPMPISVAVEGAGTSIADCCTKRGLLPLQLTDGGVYFQPCYYCCGDYHLTAGYTGRKRHVCGMFLDGLQG